MKLLKKEFRLCLHPTAPLFLALASMILIPNYPYAVSFFYVTLGVFFICLTGRENHDAGYTAALPVSRKQIVEGRILLVCCLELADLLAAALMVWLKSLIGFSPNQAGMDANIALLGEGFLVFSLFNLIFFPRWYKDINKVGAPFLLASAAVFVYILLAIVSTYAVPFVRDCLDTQDPDHLTEKLLFTGAAALVFACSAWLTVQLSVRRFEQVDLQL
ncbi:MAG: ABC-2 transporter permease [Clostridia bacterium]|nr:ABC-2 transporter permease [Clostridia bacterium]